jgi:hypothetical protein
MHSLRRGGDFSPHTPQHHVSSCRRVRNDLIDFVSDERREISIMQFGLSIRVYLVQQRVRQQPTLIKVELISNKLRPALCA